MSREVVGQPSLTVPMPLNEPLGVVLFTPLL